MDQKKNFYFDKIEEFSYTFFYMSACNGPVHAVSGHFNTSIDCI